MKAIKGLLWAIVWAVVLLAGLYIFTTSDFKALSDKLTNEVAQWTAGFAPEATSSAASQASSANSTSSSVATSSSSATTMTATPIEPNVQGKTLANTYYYQFDDDVPAAARQAFTQAIAVYNQTGIVKLVAGTGDSEENKITFSIYHKTMTGRNAARSSLVTADPTLFSASVGALIRPITPAQV